MLGVMLASATGIATPVVTAWLTRRGHRGDAEDARRLKREDALEQRILDENRQLRGDVEAAEAACDKWRERAEVEREQRLYYAALLLRHNIPADGTPPTGIPPLRRPEASP